MAALQELLESSEVADEDAAPVKLFLPQAFYKTSFQPRWVKSVGAGDEDDEDDEEDQPSVNPDRLAREFLMNRADNTSDETAHSEQDGEDTPDPDRDISSVPSKADDEEYVLNELIEGCCKQRCLSTWTVSEIVQYRYSMHELESSALDMLILGKLEAGQFDPEKNTKGKERKQQHFRYTFCGTKICESAFRVIHAAGIHYMKNLKRHFKVNGAVPRVHGNKRRLPHNVTPLASLQKVISFITSYAEESGLPMPAAPGKSKGVPPLFLPSSSNKKMVHKLYLAAIEESGLRSVCYPLFCSLWRNCLPHIQIMSLKTDVCDTCRKHRDHLTEARTEADKVEQASAYTTHVTDAMQQREKYLQDSENARCELEAAGLLDVDTSSAAYTVPAPLSADLHQVHYTFDYSQPITLPHQAQQASQLYFLSGKKIQIFGVCNDGNRCQTNYLLDEDETIKSDGGGTHGPNAVVSMVHDYLSRQTYGEKKALFHADNCSGQNKNKTFLHYLIWRVANNLNDSCEMLFMIPGHTKCLPDSKFGRIKQVFRRSDVYTKAQMGVVITKSSPSNKVRHYTDPETGAQNFKWHKWDAHFNAHLKMLEGISKFHYFRVESKQPGVVFCRKRHDSPEVAVNLVKRGHCLPLDLPPELPPAGLTAERHTYLYTKVRPHVPAVHQDVFCTQPPVVTAPAPPDSSENTQASSSVSRKKGSKSGKNSKRSPEP